MLFILLYIYSKMIKLILHSLNVAPLNVILPLFETVSRLLSTAIVIFIVLVNIVFLSNSRLISTIKPLI